MHERPTFRTRKARHRARGRPVLGWLVVVWIISQIGLALAAQSLWLRDPMFGDKLVKLRQRIAERTTTVGPPATVVVVGSSRTCFAVRGDVMEGVFDAGGDRRTTAFNFGIPAAGPITNLLTVRRLLASGDLPDLFVIEVMPPLLGDRGTGPPEHPFLAPQRLRHDELDIVLADGFPPDVAGQWWDAELTPWYGMRFPLLGRVARPWLPWQLTYSCGRQADATGWLRPVLDSVTPAEYRYGVDRAAREYFGLLNMLRFDTPAFQAVWATATLCREHGVPVVLLLMPEGSDFRSWYPPHVEDDLTARIGELSRQTGATVIDARRWLADDAFSDSHHLLPAGATRFSERLAHAIAPFIPPGFFGAGVPPTSAPVACRRRAR
jgi:hypothetical protein